MPQSFYPEVIAEPGSGSDNIAYNMGIVFYSSIAGNISAIRFWKPLGDAGEHVARLFDVATETLLGSAVFTSETDSGWQQVELSPPVNITANTQYLASVTVGAIGKKYAFQARYFAETVTAGVLTAPGGANNRFNESNPSGFPATSFNSASYFRDVVFNPAPNDVRLTGSLPQGIATVGTLRLAARINGAVPQGIVATGVLRVSTRLKVALPQSVITNANLSQSSTNQLQPILLQASAANAVLRSAIALSTSLRQSIATDAFLHIAHSVRLQAHLAQAISTVVLLSRGDAPGISINTSISQETSLVGRLRYWSKGQQIKLTIVARSNAITQVINEQVPVTVLTNASFSGGGGSGSSGSNIIKIPFAFGDVTPKPIKVVQGLIRRASVIILTPFNAPSALSLGDDLNSDRLISQYVNDPRIAAEFETSPLIQYTSPTEIKLKISPGAGCSQGNGFVILEV